MRNLAMVGEVVSQHLRNIRSLTPNFGGKDPIENITLLCAAPKSPAQLV